MLFRSMSAGRAEEETVARYGSSTVRSDGVDDLGPHGDVCVDVDTRLQ